MDLFGKRRTRMAKVEWSAGIDHVSGALSKPGKNPQHSCNKMLLGTHRTAATTNPNCNRLFLRQKDQPNGKKTMKSFLWKLEKEAYDAEHNG